MGKKREDKVGGEVNRECERREKEVGWFLKSVAFKPL